MPDHPAFTLRPLAVAETYELRRRVLRNNDPGSQVHIREDDRPEAWHLGAVDAGNAVVATSSFYPVECRFRPDAHRPYQLRFMAVDPDFQVSGVGRSMLNRALDHLRGEGATVLWANARDTALGFYTHLGFDPVGSSFVEATTGLSHTVVIKDL